MSWLNLCRTTYVISMQMLYFVFVRNTALRYFRPKCVDVLVVKLKLEFMHNEQLGFEKLSGL